MFTACTGMPRGGFDLAFWTKDMRDMDSFYVHIIEFTNL